jgi:folate-dependent phosphoribosylglycinamide formyltransferase PurN
MSEMLTTIARVYSNKPKTAILMSGAGSNARAILEDDKVRRLYDIGLIFSDNRESAAQKLGVEFGLDTIIIHADNLLGKGRREEYFDRVLRLFSRRGIQAALYAGFMKITSAEFCTEIPGVNIHPADLTILDDRGVPRYRGANALSAMRKDTGSMASSLHVVSPEVDGGRVIAVTSRVDCPPSLTDDECHDALKRHEHLLYPRGLAALAMSIDSRQLPIQMDTAAELSLMPGA